MVSPKLIALAVLASLGGATLAHAQSIVPSPPPSLGAVPSGLECTAEAANVSGFVGGDGSLVIYNVPSNQGSVRVRATCLDALGHTVSGQAAPLTPVPGGVAHCGKIDFGSYVPIAARLTMSPPSLHLVGLGSSLQLATSANFANNTNGDVTAAAKGTTYTSSNPGVALVSADGLVTAVGPGTALIYALNEGAGGLATISVLPASLASLSVVPGSLSFALSPVFSAQPAQLQVTASLTDSSTVDWTPASTGVVYESSDPSVAVVGIGGAVLGISPGSATISVIDGPSGITTQIPVVVTASSPEPSNACATPGYAHNVDIDGIWAFVASGSSGLQIINTNDCAVGGALPLTGQDVVDVRVRGPLAAVALGSGGFALVDVSSIATPHLRSTTSSIGYVRDLWINGNVLYVASSNGLFVYDVANPSAPVLIGTQVFGSPARAVAADSTRGLVVVLTGAPSAEVIQMIGSAPWPSVTVPLPSGSNHADDVTLFGTSAYVANGTSGIHEIDVTNPAAPFVKASSTLTFDALGVAVQQTPQGVFIAAADDQFVNAVPLFGPLLNNTFNINFSSFPGAIQSDANSNGIALGDGFGVVTTGPSGIQIFRSWPLVDNGGVPPTVSILTPAQSASVYDGHSIFVNVAAADDVAVSSVTLLVDGQPYGSSSTAPFHFDFPAGSAGTTHTIQLHATDPGGNVGVSLPLTVNVVTPPAQATGFTVIGGSPVNYSGIDYTVLQVAFNSSTSVGATWCDDYRALCQSYKLEPTGCGEPYTQQNDEYGACALKYGSIGGSGNLGCDPSKGVRDAAQEAGFADATDKNSFGFHYCDSGTCQKTMCTGSYCNKALSNIDLSEQHGYALCAAPPSCSDGKRNQSEKGIDCDGPCAACTKMCGDGIWNSDELGTDCGGTFCEPCPNVAYVDTPADDVPEGALFTYFSGLSAAASDFIFFKVDTNGDGNGGEWCSENAAWYVSNYLAFAPTYNVLISGNWNKYSRPTGGAWSAPDTNGYENYFGHSCDGMSYSWCSEWDLGGRQLGTMPGQMDTAGESYAGTWSYGSGWSVEIKVAATRAEACGF